MSKTKSRLTQLHCSSIQRRMVRNSWFSLLNPRTLKSSVRFLRLNIKSLFSWRRRNSMKSRDNLPTWPITTKEAISILRPKYKSQKSLTLKPHSLLWKCPPMAWSPMVCSPCKVCQLVSINPHRCKLLCFPQLHPLKNMSNTQPRLPLSKTFSSSSRNFPLMRRSNKSKTSQAKSPQTETNSMQSQTKKVSVPSSVKSSTTRSRISANPIKPGLLTNSIRHLKKPTNLSPNSIKKLPRSPVCSSTKKSSPSKKSSKSCLIPRSFSRDVSKLPICSLRINKIEIEKGFFSW